MRHWRVTTLVSAAIAASLLLVLWRSRAAIESPEAVGLLARLTPSPPPPLLSDRFRGDVAGVGHRANTLGALRPENQVPFLALANAEMFTSAAVGAAGQRSRHLDAFLCLLSDPQGGPAFKELVSIGSTPGQLYGLAGTYLTDPVFFREAIGRFRESTTPVVFLNGCNYSHVTVGEVARLIENGKLPESFRAQVMTARSNGSA